MLWAIFDIMPYFNYKMLVYKKEKMKYFHHPSTMSEKMGRRETFHSLQISHFSSISLKNLENFYSHQKGKAK